MNEPVGDVVRSLLMNQTRNWALICTLSPERQIINDGLTRSDIGCFIAVPLWQQ